MEWFKSKAGQLIALATIVSTLAGFGYAGAGYVNRLENLEAKIGGIGDTKQAQQVIETSVEYINKSIDSIVIPDNNDKLSDMKASIASLTNDVERILTDIEKLEDENKNPLAN